MLMNILVSNVSRLKLHLALNWIKVYSSSQSNLGELSRVFASCDFSFPALFRPWAFWQPTSHAILWFVSCENSAASRLDRFSPPDSCPHGFLCSVGVERYGVPSRADRGSESWLALLPAMVSSASASYQDNPCLGF